jgi:hypothetical protein
LATIQCVRSWHDAGFKPPSDRNQSEINDEEIARAMIFVAGIRTPGD